jgi:hypothetical protein
MDGGICYFKRRHVEDSETCLQFTARQDALTLTPEPIQTAPPPTVEPTVEPLPPAPLVESLPEPEAVEPVAFIVSDPPRPAWHRQPFSLHAFLKDLLGIRRLGTLNLANNFPHLIGRGETNEVNNTNRER